MSRQLILFLLATVLGAVSLGAQVVTALPAEIGDFTLTNGKSFKAAVVLSQTSAAINIRHAGGLTKVEKSLLPPELLARFPVDEAQAAKERQDRAEETRRREQAERVARQKRLAQQATARATAVTPPATPTPAPDAGARTSPRAATPQEQSARAPFGLYLQNWSGNGNVVYVSVRNPTSSPQKMDPRQLQGLTSSGQAVEGQELKFSPSEVANQWVDPGRSRSFQVAFSQGGFVALGWTDGKEWRVPSTPEAAVATNPAEAMTLAKLIAAEAKERGRQNSAAAQAASAKAAQEKRLIGR